MGGEASLGQVEEFLRECVEGVEPDYGVVVQRFCPVKWKAKMSPWLVG